MGDLLPCPFCGGIPEQDYNQSYRAVSGGSLGKACALYCTKCDAHMMQCLEDHPGVTPEELMAELVDQWNRRALPAASAEDVRAGALKEAAARLDLAAGVYADRAKDTISTNPLSAHPTDTPTEGQLLAYDYDNMQAMLDGAAAAALRAERDAILALIPEAKT